MTTLSLLIPTHREDRPYLRCLQSVAPQLRAGDEVIVVGDTHDGPLPRVERVVESLGWAFKYLAHDAGHHCYGHCQLNAGLAMATGDYYNCNDDDDVWTPDALSLMRRGAEQFPGRAMLFRFRSYMQTVYWDQLGRMERNHIGGHCLVGPNMADKQGAFACDYSGDFEYVQSAVDALGGPQDAVWLTDIVAIARP